MRFNASRFKAYGFVGVVEPLIPLKRTGEGSTVKPDSTRTHQGSGADEGWESSRKSPSTLSLTISLMPVGLV